MNEQVVSYTLDAAGEPVPCAPGEFMDGDTDRKLAHTKIASAEISTVFLGIDHNYSFQGPPVLWETMIFGGQHDQYQKRCSGSRADAQEMHNSAVQMVQASNFGKYKFGDGTTEMIKKANAKAEAKKAAKKAQLAALYAMKPPTSSLISIPAVYYDGLRTRRTFKISPSRANQNPSHSPKPSRSQLSAS